MPLLPRPSSPPPCARRIGRLRLRRTAVLAGDVRHTAGGGGAPVQLRQHGAASVNEPPAADAKVAAAASAALVRGAFDTGVWLRQIGLSQYGTVFEQNGIGQEELTAT
eukprot:gene12091-51901_t